MNTFRILIGLPACTCFLVLAAAAPAPLQNKAQVDVQLQKIFNKLDKNGDGYLDAEELAHALRGPKAKPAPPLYDDKGNVNPEYVKAKSKYPDMIYLNAMDKDGDGKVSWDEFRTYGEAYAADLQQKQAKYLSLQKAYLQAMQRRYQAMYRQANYNRYRYRGAHPRYYPHRNYRSQNYYPNYQNTYVYQQRMMQQYQSTMAQAMRMQQNIMRQQMARRQAYYVHARQMVAHRAPVQHFRFRR